jgi:DNA polymerase
MDGFLNKKDIYRQFAGRMYRVDPDSIPKDDPRRHLGKTAILGLGYGMGGPKFRETAGAAGIELSEGEAEATKALYRQTYPEVPAFWKNCESAFRAAIQRKTTVQCDKVWFGYNGEWGWTLLPSGRAIWYYQPQLKRVVSRFDKSKTTTELSYMGMDTRTKQWSRRHTYGGSLVESICQGMTACLLADIMPRAEAAGFPIILTVHDELVAEVDQDVPKELFHEIVRSRPPWGPDLPVECETHEARRYGK